MVWWFSAGWNFAVALADRHPERVSAMSEDNSMQRELLSTMPLRLEHSPLGQVSQDLDSAPNKIDELDTALSSAD